MTRTGYTHDEALRDMNKLYKPELDALAEAGLDPALEYTGGGCYVITCLFKDGSLASIGSNDGPLSRFDEEPRPLEVLLYPSEEAVSDGGPFEVFHAQSPAHSAEERIAPLVSALTAHAREAEGQAREK